MKVSEIISKVEYTSEVPNLIHGGGTSIVKSPTEWKETYDKRHEVEARKKATPDPSSPTRDALGKLQDQGLGRSMGDIQEATIIGKK